MLIWSEACTATESGVRIDEEHVLYDGEPYGDFVLLGEAVRDCMHADDRPLPSMVLVEGLFECYTVAGWKRVLGCTSEQRIYMDSESVAASSGQLWSHELTHYFGGDDEGDPCGALALEGFDLAIPDGDS